MTKPKYSGDLHGSDGNNDWPVRFDKCERYLGITQLHEGEPPERVLLSPDQVRALFEFYGVPLKPCRRPHAVLQPVQPQPVAEGAQLPVLWRFVDLIVGREVLNAD